jgi:hypothetical protein
MHAILITFQSAVSLDELRQPSGAPLHLSEYSAALQERPGFLSKTWLQDGATYGGFYLFADRSAAESYVAELHDPIARANPAMTNIQVRHFTVHEEMSGLTLGLPASRVSV